MGNEDKIVRFQGIIEEIKCIAVDYFRDLNVGAYFLSHCHADHMAGLSAPQLSNYLRSSNVFIYCSSVSLNILAHWPNYNHLVPHLKPLDINFPYFLEIATKDGSETTSFCVTLVSSGHCPGSVMFLFEGSFGTVLYTGDFRLGLGDGKKLPVLREDPRKCDAGFKRFDHVYLDCTFCLPKAEKLPIRSHVLFEIAKIIKSWINTSPEHHVLLSTSARFGSEFLFVELFEKLKMKIHVSSDKYDMYKNIKVLRNAITTDSKSTRIHSCLDRAVFYQVNTLPCFGNKSKAQICTVRPTTQWHLWKGRSEVIVEERGLFRVLYSMHSSLEEIKDFVSSLKPKRITPISKPDYVTADQIQAMLQCNVTLPAKFTAKSYQEQTTIVTEKNVKSDYFSTEMVNLEHSSRALVTETGILTEITQDQGAGNSKDQHQEAEQLPDSQGSSGSHSSVEVIEIVRRETVAVSTPDKVQSGSLEFEFDSPSLFEVGRHEAVLSQYKRRLPFDTETNSAAKSLLLTSAGTENSHDDTVIIID